jgi:hypothetical protein
MNKESYTYTIDNESFSYTFVSKGVQGEILKVVEFQAINPHIYNLLLANYEAEGNYLDDFGVSNNGDIVKILATVFKIVAHFLENNPKKLVYIEANTEVKHKLYTRVIRNNLEQIRTIYQIFGVLENDDFETFRKESTYTAFIIRKIL